MAETIKETILQELLDPANYSGLDKVLAKHRRSKGPLYLALAEATATMEQDLARLVGEKAEAEKELSAKRQAAADLDSRIARQEEHLGVLDQHCHEAEGRLAVLDVPIREAEALQKLGFGQAELARLSTLLGALAASQGLVLQDGVSTFFDFVERCKDVLALDLEAQRARNAGATAKSEAERWEATARAAEAKSKLRQATLDLAEGLVAQGVKQQDFAHWHSILSKAGLTPEALTIQLAKLGSIEAMYGKRKEEAQQLTRKASTLKIQVVALQKEKARTVEAITVVKREALDAVQTLKREALGYGDLQRQSGLLELELTLARSIISDDPEQWKRLHPQIARTLLVGLVHWARGRSDGLKSAPPADVAARVREARYVQLTPADLLYWSWSALELHSGWARAR